MANKFIKTIRETGIVISKTYSEAKPSRTDMNGRTWPATAEKYSIEVISCDQDDFNKDTGILNGTRAVYEVTKDVYEKAKFGDWANVKFTANEYNGNISIKPEGFLLVEKK